MSARGEPAGRAWQPVTDPGGAGPLPGSAGPPWGATVAVLVSFLALSQAVPWATRAFGGNVPPLFARLSPDLGVGILAPVAMAGAAWVLAPRVAHLRPAVFLAAAVVFGWAFATALAAQAGGLAAVAEPFERPLDYFANVPLVDALGPRAFAESYPDLTERLSLHAATHPPGAPLLLWALNEALGGSVVAVSVAVALIGALGAAPTYWLARGVAGDRVARLAVLLFVSSPAVLLFSATSMDAVFMTVTALAMAAAVRAPRSEAWALATGVLTALGLLLTFGAAAVGLVALGAAAVTGRKVPIGALVRRGLLAAAGLVAGGLLLRLAVGVDLVATFRAALDAHLGDPSRDRVFGYWVVGNVVAFLFASGLAHTALAADETRRAWRARRPGAETVLWGAVVVSTATGLFKGEVEHIWLFLVPLLAVTAAAALARRDDRTARWVVAAGLGQALLMEVLLFTFW